MELVLMTALGFGAGDNARALMIAGGVALQNIPEGMVIIGPMLTAVSGARPTRCWWDSASCWFPTYCWDKGAHIRKAVCIPGRHAAFFRVSVLESGDAY